MGDDSGHDLVCQQMARRRRRQGRCGTVDYHLGRWEDVERHFRRELQSKAVRITGSKPGDDQPIILPDHGIVFSGPLGWNITSIDEAPALNAVKAKVHTAS